MNADMEADAADTAPALDLEAPPIRVRGLVSKFGDNVVHDGLDLTIPRGKVVGVVGGSGAGKSVLLNSIIGLRQPQGGTICIFGQDIRYAKRRVWTAIERRWGVLFQAGALWSNLTVKENVSAPLFEHTDMKKGEVGELADLKIALAGLPPGAGALKPSEGAGARSGTAVPRRADVGPRSDQRRRFRRPDQGSLRQPATDRVHDHTRPGQSVYDHRRGGGDRRQEGGGHGPGARAGTFRSPLDQELFPGRARTGGGHDRAG
jgi:ABC-type dipeptide/oligopeptide/nickel transport system ATPase component